MIARRFELLAAIHKHVVGRVIHMGGPEAAALETVAVTARDHADDYSVFTGL
jgi:hypothetical protein